MLPHPSRPLRVIGVVCLYGFLGFGCGAGHFIVGACRLWAWCSRVRLVVQTVVSVFIRPWVCFCVGSYHLTASILAWPWRFASSRAGARSVSRDASTTTS